MAVSDNYYRWIYDVFDPHLGNRILEIGAGSGNFSRFLAGRPGLERLVLVEPSTSMFSLLQSGDLARHPAIELHHGTFASACEIDAGKDVSSIVAMNVLEHVEDDVGLVREISAALPPGGSLCLMVPALAWLYSRFDREIGHYRRYTRTSLSNAINKVGDLQIVKSGYLDFLGVLPWLVAMRWFRGGLSPRNVRLYDRVGVPVTRMIERHIPPPLGKNVYVIAHRR